MFKMYFCVAFWQPLIAELYNNLKMGRNLIIQVFQHHQQLYLQRSTWSNVLVCFFASNFWKVRLIFWHFFVSLLTGIWPHMLRISLSTSCTFANLFFKLPTWHSFSLSFQLAAMNKKSIARALFYLILSFGATLNPTAYNLVIRTTASMFSVFISF